MGRLIKEKTMTIKDISRRARELLNDNVTPYRWSAETMREALRDAVRRLNSVQPATRYVNGALLDGVVVPEDVDENFPIDGRYREAIVFYVVAKCYQSDSPDTANAQLAESFLAKAEALMRS